MFRLLFCLFALWIVLLTQCAIPCPKDVKIGVINLSPATLAFLPSAQRVAEMTFTDNAGNSLVFYNQNSLQAQRSKMLVEVLCERGDFLDKSVQVVYYDTESYHFYYRSADGIYTIGLDMQLNNANYTGNRADTVLYETFAVYAFGNTPTATNGVVSVLTNTRGHETGINDDIKANANMHHFVADTLIGGNTLSNVWITPAGELRDIFIYYSQANGIEALQMNQVTWWRE